MKFKKEVISVLTLAAGISGLYGQTAVPATGGEAKSASGSVSYSAGQVFYTTNTGSEGAEAQGVQQPYEISQVTGVNDAMEINLSFSAYPNPATDFLILKVDRDKIENLSYQLFDLNGKLIENKKIVSNETHISTFRLVPAVYFIQVMEGTKEVKTFKIIKN